MPAPMNKSDLKDRVVQHVQQAAGKPENRHDRIAGGDPEHADAEADQDDADIFNAAGTPANA